MPIINTEVESAISNLYGDIYDTPDPCYREKSWNIIIDYIKKLEDELLVPEEVSALKEYVTYLENLIIFSHSQYVLEDLFTVADIRKDFKKSNDINKG